MYLGIWKKEVFDKEKRTMQVNDICYAIIKEDKNRTMLLETALSRLSCNHVFNHQEGYTAFPFSGFTLANYVKAWWNQKGKKRLFMRPGKEDHYKLFPDFKPMNSSD